jgi:hypothetical protein
VAVFAVQGEVTSWLTAWIAAASGKKLWSTMGQ